jgi:Na+-transporting methylmalonyl-CoA/oxaloacetate decarboxylase gamma subunit
VNWLIAWWQAVSATVATGLEITVIGMALVFLTLGLIIIALILLTRLPGLSQTPKKERDLADQSPPDRSAEHAGSDVVSTRAESAQDVELAQVAAIAVVLLRSRRTKQPRSRTQVVTSRWKQCGRAHQLGL